MCLKKFEVMCNVNRKSDVKEIILVALNEKIKLEPTNNIMDRWDGRSSCVN